MSELIAKWFCFPNSLPTFCGEKLKKILAVLILWDFSGVTTAQNQDNTM